MSKKKEAKANTTAASAQRQQFCRHVAGRGKEKSKLVAGYAAFNSSNA